MLPGEPDPFVGFEKPPSPDRNRGEPSVRAAAQLRKDFLAGTGATVALVTGATSTLGRGFKLPLPVHGIDGRQRILHIQKILGTQIFSRTVADDKGRVNSVGRTDSAHEFLVDQEPFLVIFWGQAVHTPHFNSIEPRKRACQSRSL
jgi:hypothetical protein